jgi:DNA invertase Pin-like site-specific DNA recombinase
MRLVGYARVSSEGQLDGFGLDVQERIIREWAGRYDLRLTTLHRDGAVRGTTDAVERAGLTAALTDLRDGRADGLIVATLDRLARKLTVQEAILGMAWQHGARVFTADDGECREDDPDDPMRTAIRQMRGVFAQLDRALVVKRLRDGRRAKEAAGRKSCGTYAYGFTGAGKGRERDAVADEAEQLAVRRIIELRQSGASYRVIAETLDCEGFRPRRAVSWNAMTVRAVAQRADAEQGARPASHFPRPVDNRTTSS